MPKQQAPRMQHQILLLEDARCTAEGKHESTNAEILGYDYHLRSGKPILFEKLSRVANLMLCE
jgi:hypothetical protein